MSEYTPPVENITVTGQRPPKRDPNELTITAGGMVYGGWQEVRVTRGVERMPSDFDVTLTELYPGQAARVAIEPGLDCVVRLGNDVVITGHIDVYHPSYNASGHQVRISGRGLCADIVDCAAGFSTAGATGGQFGNGSVFSIASAICANLGIKVINMLPNLGKPIPQFNLTYGEKCFEVIDRIARYAAQLAYEDQYGNLVLSQIGTTQAASGFQEGVNVQAASGAFSMLDRFSDYFAFTVGTSTLQDMISERAFQVARATDPTVTRFRPTVIVTSEMQEDFTAAGADAGTFSYVAALRANWEKSRRYGRSQAVTLTCDSWRDSAGKLWAPNTLAPVHLPHCKRLNKLWVISEVTYLRGDAGTTADLTLMPPEAFQPEPVALQLFDWQAATALNSGGASKP